MHDNERVKRHRQVLFEAWVPVLIFRSITPGVYQELNTFLVLGLLKMITEYEYAIPKSWPVSYS